LDGAGYFIFYNLIKIYYWFKAYLSHARMNLNREEKNVDFVCMSPHKNLGGSESTGVLIVKKSAYKITSPSFPVFFK